jgi:hypothetical protein
LCWGQFALRPVPWSTAIRRRGSWVAWTQTGRFSFL